MPVSLLLDVLVSAGFASDGDVVGAESLDSLVEAGFEDLAL